jgi:hypothetical protein
MIGCFLPSRKKKKMSRKVGVVPEYTLNNLDSFKYPTGSSLVISISML